MFCCGCNCVVIVSYDIMSGSEGKQAWLIYPERRMAIMNEVHDTILRNRQLDD